MCLVIKKIVQDIIFSDNGLIILKIPKSENVKRGGNIL